MHLLLVKLWGWENCPHVDSNQRVLLLICLEPWGQVLGEGTAVTYGFTSQVPKDL